MKKNVLDYYLDPILKDYVNFDGRATRKDFWMFTLFNFIVYIIISVVGGVIHFPMLSMIYGLAVFLPLLAISVRRLHDTGRSGWWVLLYLIPSIVLFTVIKIFHNIDLILYIFMFLISLIGEGWSFALLLGDSDGDNKYGKSLLNTVNDNSIENNSIENNSIENNSIENNSIENNSIENNSIENKDLNNKKNIIKIIMIVSQFSFLGLLGVDFILILFSPMLFDAPGSENNPYLTTFFESLISYPIAVILSIIFSWIFYKFRLYIISLIITLLPLIYIITALVAWYLISTKCHGNFSC